MRDRPDIPRSARIAPAPDVAAARIGEEFTLLHLGRGLYHGLAGVGAEVWEMASRGRTVGEIEEDLAREYDADVDRIRRDLDALLRGLLDRGLIEIRERDETS